MTLRNKERAPVVRVLARDGSVLAERGAATISCRLNSCRAYVSGRHRRDGGPALLPALRRRSDRAHPRGFFANLRAGRFAQGGSTLTQQLAKNLFLTTERTLSRKARRVGACALAGAAAVEGRYPRTLSQPGLFRQRRLRHRSGSQRYFHKSARALTLAEAAIMAGLLKAPSKYSPASNPGAARARGRVVLAKMADAGLISTAEQHRALDERIVFHAANAERKSTGVDYAVEFVSIGCRRSFPAGIGSHRRNDARCCASGTRRRSRRRRSRRPGRRAGASQAAIVVLDEEAASAALIGGKDYTRANSIAP